MYEPAPVSVARKERGLARGTRRARVRTWAWRLTGREYSVFGATTLLMAAFLVSAGLGAVRQVLFNARFGTGMEATAFYASVRLPDILFTLIAGGALSAALIPVYLATERDDGPEAARRLAALVLNTLSALLLLFSTICFVFARPLMERVVPGFDPPTRDLTVALTRIMLVQPLVLGAGSVLKALLHCRNQFFLPALSVATHNIAIIAGISAAFVWREIGIYGPAAGVVAGAVLQVAVLLPGLRGADRPFRAVWRPRDRRLLETGRLLAPNVLAVAVGYVAFLVEARLISRLPDKGSLAALQNAYLLSALPLQLLAGAVGLAVFPRMAAAVAAGDRSALWRRLWQTVLVVLALAVASALLTLLLGRFAVRLLFEHGAFTARDGDFTTRLLFIYAVGLPSFVVTEALVRAFLADRRPGIQIITNSGQTIIRLIIVLALIGPLAAAAIPVALVVSAVAETLALLWLARRLLKPEKCQ